MIKKAVVPVAGLGTRMMPATLSIPKEMLPLGRKPVIPQETCVLIPCDSLEEAQYLADLLNGDRVDEIVRSVSAAGSKGFGSPGILDYLGIRRFPG